MKMQTHRENSGERGEGLGKAEVQTVGCKIGSQLYCTTQGV